MTRPTKRELESRIDDLTNDGPDGPAGTDTEMGVSAPFVTFERDTPGDGAAEFIVITQPDADDEVGA